MVTYAFFNEKDEAVGESQAPFDRKHVLACIKWSAKDAGRSVAVRLGTEASPHVVFIRKAFGNKPLRWVVPATLNRH